MRSFDVDFCNLLGFKKLESQREQIKQVLFLFGYCFARFASIDSFFIACLQCNKFELEGRIIGKTYTKEEQENYIFYCENKATTRRLVSDFTAKFDTTNFDELFNELVEIRNVLAHKYMRINWQYLDNQEAREGMYENLLEFVYFLNEFEEKMVGAVFYSRADRSNSIKWNRGKTTM